MITINYEDFVRERFKVFPGTYVEVNSPQLIGGKALTLHHATTGMVGEALEMMFAPDRKALLKECGDFEFYLEAMTQNLPPDPDPLLKVFTPWANLPDLLLQIVVKSTDLLDLTKKMWIYEQEVDAATFWAYRKQVRMLMDYFYGLSGITLREVLHLNIEKLLKRYPKGYSNQEAQDRADGEGQRHDTPLAS